MVNHSDSSSAVSKTIVLTECHHVHCLVTSAKSKATLQVVEHALQVLCGLSLKDFSVTEEYLDKLLSTPINDLAQLILPPVHQRYTLRIVSWPLVDVIENDYLLKSKVSLKDSHQP